MKDKINSINFFTRTVFFCFTAILGIYFVDPCILEATDLPETSMIDNATKKLQKIHSKLRLLHGNFSEEYPEQMMSAMFIQKDAKVLELGGNVGRNSCVIDAILSNKKNLVVMEPCREYAKLLQENRDINGLQFHIEVSALSKVPLIQKGWDTIPSDVVLPGYFRIDSTTFDELEAKYSIQFDTLVADCEGALFYILKDDPKILEKVKLILVENDFHNVQHAEFVHEQFKKYGFQVVYNQAGGWGPCYNYFFQVWKK